MKCPKCSFTTFDHAESCKKCGRDFSDVKAKYGIYHQQSAPQASQHPIFDDESLDGFSLPSAEEEGLDLSFPSEPEEPSWSEEEGASLSVPEEEEQPAEAFEQEEEPLPAAAPDEGELDYAAEEEEEFEEDFSAPEEEEPEEDEDWLMGEGNLSFDFGEDEDDEEVEEEFYHASDNAGVIRSLVSLPVRVAAVVLDLGLLLGLFVLFVLAGQFALTAPQEPLTLPGREALLELATPYFLVGFALFFGYFTFFHFLAGQTPGKMVFRIVVEGEDGAPLSFSQAFLRSVGGLFSVVFLGVGFLLLLGRADRRGWNDRLAGTRVVPHRQQESLLTSPWEKG